MTYRNVATAIWTDDTILSMSPEQKLVLLYLHTCPYTSACGIFTMHPRTMGFQIGLTHSPFESALKGLCAAFPDFVAADWETMEVALLQYPRQLLISANAKTMAIVGKDVQSVKSQYLLRELIRRNSAGLSAPYLAQLRRLQMQAINSKDVNVLLDGNVSFVADNQEFTPEIEIEIEKKDIMSFSVENDVAQKVTISIPESAQQDQDTPPPPAAQIIDYLNAKTGRKYRAKTATTAKAINARLEDGYTVADFFAVIDNRVAAWLHKPEMAEYLRPETLFRPAHFESYLNAGINPAKANTNEALKDCPLPDDIAPRYEAYFNHALQTYPALLESATKVFSHCDYLDYWNNTSTPGLPFSLTPSDKRRVMLTVHEQLNANKYLREKYSSVFAAYIVAVKQSMKQETIKL